MTCSEPSELVESEFYVYGSGYCAQSTDAGNLRFYRPAAWSVS